MDSTTITREAVERVRQLRGIATLDRDNSSALLSAGLVGAGLLLVRYPFRLMNRECGD